MGKLFALFFAIVSIVLAYGIFYQFQLSQRMVTTEGEICNTPKGNVKDIHVRRGFDWDSTIARGRAYIIDVPYRYSVNGKIYDGKQLRIDGNAYVFKENADKVVEMLKRERNVTVWYDPLQPSRSVLLKPGIQQKAIIGLLGCLLLTYASYRYLDTAILYLARFKKSH